MPATNFTIPSIFTAVDKFSAPVAKMAAANQSFASRAEVGIARVDRAVNRLTPGLGRVTKQMMSMATAAIGVGAILTGIHFSSQSLKDWEVALDSAQAITGTSDKEFAAFKTQMVDVAKTTKQSAVEVAKGFEIVGSQQPELLKNAAALGKVTEASITLAKASRDDLATSSQNLTGVMNQFDLKADQASRTMNVLAAGSVVGAANITQIGESMKNFGSVAASSNITLEQSVALVETVAKFGLKGAEAGTKLRGATLKLQQAGLGYASGQFQIADALEETRKKFNALKTAKEKDAFLNKTFGAENVSTGKILVNNIDLFKQYTQGVTGTNTAYTQAAQNTSNFSTKVEELKNKFVNLLVSSNSTTDGLGILSSIVVFLTDNMETIITVAVLFISTWAALKIAILASRTALLVYNVMLGISTVLQGKSLFALRASTVAMTAAKIATKAVTAAQWLWNAALAANPIGLIIVAIAALAAAIYFIIDKWNEWGASIAFVGGLLGGPVMGVIMAVISIIQSVRRNWDLLVEAFTTGGILEGIKMVGKVLLDAVLMPIQQIVGLIAKFTGADWASQAVRDIENFRAELGVNTTTDENGNPIEPVNPPAAQNQALAQQVNTNNANVTIDNRSGFPVTTDNPDMVRVNRTPSFGM